MSRNLIDRENIKIFLLWGKYETTDDIIKFIDAQRVFTDEPFINKPCISEGACHDIAVQDLIECEDCISRTEAMKPFLKPYEPEKPEKWCSFEVKNYLEDLPSAQPKQKTGWWIKSQNGLFAQCDKCSLFGEYEICKHWKYCPNCGAKMAESEDK